MCPRRPIWIPEDAPPLFPNPRAFDPAGLVAGGGDLSRARLLAAYRQGLFPWFNEEPILWWSPDPRAILDPEHLHVSRSLWRTLRNKTWTVRATRDLNDVLSGCAEREEGTWLTAEMHAAYANLGVVGDALAYEVRDGDELIGGLYGVWVGGLFAAESKFHRQRDASKVALVAAVTHLFALGVRLLDVQFLTPHLASLGVFEIGRDVYLHRLAEVTALGREPGPGALVPPEIGEDLLPWLREMLREQPQ